jgi:hypothetical protein
MPDLTMVLPKIPVPRAPTPDQQNQNLYVVGLNISASLKCSNMQPTLSTMFEISGSQLIYLTSILKVK